MVEGGYNVMRSRDGNYITWRWRLYERLSEEKSAEFIPEKKKIVIYAREKLQKHDISSSCHIPGIPIGLVGIALYPSFSIGYRGRVLVLPYNHNYTVLIGNIFHSIEGVNSG